MIAQRPVSTPVCCCCCCCRLVSLPLCCCCLPLATARAHTQHNTSACPRHTCAPPPAAPWRCPGRTPASAGTGPAPPLRRARPASQHAGSGPPPAGPCLPPGGRLCRRNTRQQTEAANRRSGPQPSCGRPPSAHSTGMPFIHQPLLVCQRPVLAPTRTDTHTWPPLSDAVGIAARAPPCSNGEGLLGRPGAPLAG
jgi:hypothetical protein